MKKKYKISVFIFRNDLRLFDNVGLIEALKSSELVIPIFVFNKKQITIKNKYRSLNAMLFLKNSLIDLNSQLNLFNSKLYMFYDEINDIIFKLKKYFNIEAIFINEDYTPFSVDRDKKIKELCEKISIDFNSFFDKLLLKPKETLKENGEPYTIFTPFFRKNSLKNIEILKNNLYKNYFKEDIEFDLEKFPKEFDYDNKNLFVKGGRKEGLDILNKDVIKLKDYDLLRDFPEKEGTSKLSAHIKFGTISIREVYHFLKENFGENHSLIRQLYWRDFFYSIAYFYPKVFGKSFHEKYDKIKWDFDKEKFDAWKNGKTGFPIVDAGMRQLNETGYMHNRVRMIVSSFLVKDLHIDWREGERYFATKLVDYDPCINNGNWQWAASTGCDSQPYFRIFNPWRQQVRFDENCIYIKKWVPELKDLKPKEIHNLYKNLINVENYPKPIINHDIESKISKFIYKEI
jgi:deoxyribodipyrimidine photo-lyase